MGQIKQKVHIYLNSLVSQACFPYSPLIITSVALLKNPIQLEKKFKNAYFHKSESRRKICDQMQERLGKGRR